MDCSGLPYSNAANTVCSPAIGVFTYSDIRDETYLTDVYTTQQDYANTFVDQPGTSIEFTPGYESRNQLFLNQTIENSAEQLSSQANDANGLPFCRLSQLISNSFDPSDITPFHYGFFNSSQRSSSPTPSVCGDTGYQTAQSQASLSSQQVTPSPSYPAFSKQVTDTPLSSHLSLKFTSPSSSLRVSPSPLTKLQRKRGRPRLGSQYNNSSKPHTGQRRTHRLSHNQIERKYREGLNSQIERLRCAVPTLSQYDESNDALGQAKPTKAIIIAEAIKRIKILEKETDEANKECERLKSANANGWKGAWDRKSVSNLSMV